MSRHCSLSAALQPVGPRYLSSGWQLMTARNTSDLAADSSCAASSNICLSAQQARPRLPSQTKMVVSTLGSSLVKYTLELLFHCSPQAPARLDSDTTCINVQEHQLYPSQHPVLAYGRDRSAPARPDDRSYRRQSAQGAWQSSQSRWALCQPDDERHKSSHWR